mgnify:CR=1 FL=1
MSTGMSAAAAPELAASDERLADSVNHLLVVGFYLINLGYVTLALKLGDKPASTQGAIEFLSTKVGLVLLVLGAMHFFNMHAIATFGRKVAGWLRGLMGLPEDATEAETEPAPAEAAPDGAHAGKRRELAREADFGRRTARLGRGEGRSGCQQERETRGENKELHEFHLPSRVAGVHHNGP